jgi:hypothetical protein
VRSLQISREQGISPLYDFQAKTQMPKDVKVTMREILVLCFVASKCFIAEGTAKTCQVVKAGNIL